MASSGQCSTHCRSPQQRSGCCHGAGSALGDEAQRVVRARPDADAARHTAVDRQHQARRLPGCPDAQRAATRPGAAGRRCPPGGRRHRPRCGPAPGTAGSRAAGPPTPAVVGTPAPTASRHHDPPPPTGPPAPSRWDACDTPSGHASSAMTTGWPDASEGRGSDNVGGCSRKRQPAPPRRPQRRRFIRTHHIWGLAATSTRPAQHGEEAPVVCPDPGCHLVAPPCENAAVKLTQTLT